MKKNAIICAGIGHQNGITDPVLASAVVTTIVIKHKHLISGDSKQTGICKNKEDPAFDKVGGVLVAHQYTYALCIIGKQYDPKYTHFEMLQ